ncbi:MAG: hypothetical protein AB9835_02310 [Eubacteriales bacterium]
MYYSIHTFELTKEIDIDEYNRICILFNNDSKINKYRIICKGNYYKPLKYNNMGISIVLNYTPFHKRKLKIIVNPKAVIEFNNIFEIFNPSKDDLGITFKNINVLLSFLGEKYTIDDFMLTRIDCCVDIHLSNEMEVLEIISLAKKSKKAIGFHKTYSAKIKKKMKKIYRNKNSFDITNTNRKISFVMYSKYLQLLDIKYSEEDANRVRGVLRIELKVSDIKNDNNTNCNIIKWYVENSKNIFRSNINDLFTPGIYMKLDMAKQYIKSYTKNNKLREILLFLFDETSYRRNYRLAFKNTIVEYKLDSRKKKELLEWMKYHAINPTTIGVRKWCSCYFSIYTIMKLNDSEDQERELRLIKTITEKGWL